MNLLHGFQRPDLYRNCAVAIGNFDGVHRGHQHMVGQLVRTAGEVGGPAVVLTFEPHPIRLLRPDETPPSLSTLQRKATLLAEYGVHSVIAYPTDADLLNLSPEEFFQRIIVEELQARAVVEGPNFCFGRDRAGDVDLLMRLGHQADVLVRIVPPMNEPGQTGMVSSSRVRQLIGLGQLDEAVELLGHPYQLAGVVAGGQRRGREIGFPTANLEQIMTLVPAEGVYAGRVVWQGRRVQAAVHIGTNPTFGENERKVEVHLLDFAADLYGERLAVDLLSRVRGIKRFESVNELTRQLEADVAEVRRRGW